MSAKSRRPSRSDLKNLRGAELSWSEMTADQREQELLQFLDSLSRSSQAERKPIDPEKIKRAARRGFRKAKKFLAENPARDDMQAAWDIHECEMHMLDDSPVDFAYHAAYLKTLKRRVTVSLLAEEKKARPILTIMAGFCLGPVWLNWIGDDSIGVGGSCCESVGRCGCHPISDALFEAFNAWVAEFGAAPWSEGSLTDPDDPKSGYLVHPQIILNWPDFHTRGLALAKRLKDEVGAAFGVIYEKTTQDPVHHYLQRREVHDDGSVIPLPSRAIGRYSLGT